MIDWLIFSKDRPLQLQALLHSIDRQQVPRLSVSVLYHASDPESLLDYRQLREDNPSVVFRDDHSGFQNGVTAWLELMGPVIAFLTDDCLFYRPAPMPRKDQLPYVYRLGRNTVSTSTQGIDSPPPAGLSWKWHGKPGDFGYPLALDGHVYLLDDLLPLFDQLDYHNPTQLEAGLASRWRDFEPDTLHMGEHSCLVSIPHNRVSGSSGCAYSGDPRYTVEQLQADYRQGRRIIPTSMDFTNITDAHQEVPYVIR